jgi:hypothetical protein
MLQWQGDGTLPVPRRHPGESGRLRRDVLIEASIPQAPRTREEDNAMSTSDGIGRDHPVTPANQLADAVEAANTLLYHAVSSGQDVPCTVRDPIIRARATVERGTALADDEEGRFLDAYAKLALRVAPVTAATLAATSRRYIRRGWLGSLTGFRAVSDAQRLAARFGLIALCLIAAIAGGEWMRALIGSIAAAEKQFGSNSQELSEAITRREAIEDQIAMIAQGNGSSPDTASVGAMREALKGRLSEINAKIWALRFANGELDDTISKGYETIERIPFVSRDNLKHVSTPLGGFLLPVLYGALGTCAFVMRSLFREMVDRTFDARRTGEFTVRIFLGMLSGLTVQWLVVRSDGTVAGGVTPVVLAFVGGYSVEMLFTAMDRLVQLVVGRARPPHRSQAGTRLPRRSEEPGTAMSRRTRPRGPAVPPLQRAANPAAELAPMQMVVRGDLPR